MVAFLSRTEVWVGGLSLAAFIVLYWTLRGAPMGQGVTGEGEDAPASGYRDRMIAAVVFGLILLLAGAYIAVSVHLLWSLPVFACGFGIVLVLAAKNRRYRHGSPALRRTLELSDAILNAVLLAGVLIVVNVLAFRYGGRALDFTRERAFSLSERSVNTIKSLDRPVTFTILFGRSNAAVPQLVRVQQLLELYKAAAPDKVQIANLNPFAEVQRYQALVKEVPDVGIVIGQHGGGILIEYGSGKDADRYVIRSDDLFDIPRGNRAPDQFQSKFIGEDAVTSALIRLKQGDKPVVAFTTGHGERPAATTDPKNPANGLLRSRLGSVGFDVIDLDLRQEDLSRRIALVIVAAPKTKFQPDELAKLRSYMLGGGPAIFLIGWDDLKEGLDGLLKDFNIDIGDGMVVDPQVSGRFKTAVEYLWVPITGQIAHPIVDPLSERPVLVPYALPLKVRTPGPDGKGASPQFIATPILRPRPGTGFAWAETDRDSIRSRQPKFDKDKDAPGATIAVGIAVADREKAGEAKGQRPRLVVISSGAFGDDRTIQTQSTGQDVLMNSIGWLRGQNELLGTGPESVHVMPVFVANPVLRNRLITVPTLMAFMVIILLGLVTYSARRA